MRFYQDPTIGKYTMIGDGVIGENKFVMGDVGCIEPKVAIRRDLVVGNRACIRRLDDDGNFAVSNLPTGRRCVLIRGECVQ